MHPFAEKAAEAAECAGRQGRFWEMHAQLFRNQQQLAIENLFRYASDIHLDPDLFGRCLNGEASQTVKDDVALATSFAISATPTFFVGVVQSDGQVKVTDRLAGAQPAQQFEAAVDKLLTANLSDARK
jgi:protein-disulfide isomerase